MGLKAVAAKVHQGPSWVDGKGCIVLDHSRPSLIAHRARDEIRLVAPALHLGIAFGDRVKIVHLALSFRPSFAGDGPTSRRFDRRTLDDLARAEEVDLETRSRTDKVTRRTIRVVVVDDQVYVRSVRGTAGRWHRALREDRDAALCLGSRRLPVVAVPVTESQTVGRMSKAYLSKYASSPYAPPMVREGVLATMFRIDPASRERVEHRSTFPPDGSPVAASSIIPRSASYCSPGGSFRIGRSLRSVTTGVGSGSPSA